MSERSPSDTPPRLVLDFSQPMRPKPCGRVKIIPAAEPSPSADIFAHPNRRALSPARPVEQGDSGGE